MFIPRPVRVVCLLATWTISCNADTLVMKNGDRVSGRIVKKDGDKITVKTDNFGAVTTSWDAVSSVQSEGPLNVVFKDGKNGLGVVSASEGRVVVTAKEGPLTAPAGDIIVIRDADEQRAYERMLAPGWR